MITVDDSLDDGECAWDEFRHYSKTMCGKVLDAIDSKYGDDDNLIRVGYNFTTDRKYKRVQTTYKPGCSRCTLLGHSEEKCTNKIGTKRPVSASSVASTPKSVRH